MRSRISGGSLLHLQRCVDARHQSLARSFFVAAGSVDLSAEKQPGNLLGFKSAFEFRRIDRVVFDGITGPQHLGVLKARNGLQNLQLDLDRQRGAHAVDVNLMSVQALGLEKELVCDLVGKLDDLVFNRRAVARTDGMDLSAVHGRTVDVFPDDALSFRSGPRDVARHLRIMMGDPPGAKAEGRRIVVAGLDLEARPVDGAAIEARRGSRLQPATAQAEPLEGLAQQDGGRFARASRGILLFAAMNQAIEESAGRDDDRAGANRAAVAQSNAYGDGAVVGRQSSVVRKTCFFGSTTED